MKMTRAAQIHPKVIILSIPKGSLYINTAMTRDKLGAIYWNIPAAVSDSLVTAAAKQSSGKEVTTPPSISSISVCLSTAAKLKPAVLDSQNRPIMAKGKTTMVSSVRPTTEGKFRFFRMSP